MEDKTPIQEFIARIEGAKEGDLFTVAGQMFTRRKLTLQDNHRLQVIALRMMERVHGSTLAEMFLESSADLVDAAAIILEDQRPECNAEWLWSQRDLEMSKLLEPVLAQMKVAGMDALLTRIGVFAKVLTSLQEKHANE